MNLKVAFGYGPKLFVRFGARMSRCWDALVFESAPLGVPLNEGALQSSDPNVGALISDVRVYVKQSGSGGEPSYNVTLSAVNQAAKSVSQGITENFESNGV